MTLHVNALTSGAAPRRLLAAAALLAASSLPATVLAQAWSYQEAAKPYAGTTIRVLDEITPLQETLKTLVPQFTAETGIKVEYELLNHFEVINKGQADMLSRRGHYDGVMLHGVQMGQLLAADTIAPIDEFLQNTKLASPTLDMADMIEPAASSLTKFKGQTYGFLNWNYNMIYWLRADLLEHPQEKAAFQAKYGYALAPAKSFKEFLDLGEFFTRKAGEQLAGQTLKSDFYGILHEGITGGNTLPSVWFNIMKNYGADWFDAQGRPSFDSPQAVEALTAWARMWKYAPPGQAEYSLVDVPTVMGNGIAAQTIAFSDFVLGIDKPGASPLAGKFTYAPIPSNPSVARSADGEPSAIVINKASKNKAATFLFLQWLVEKDTQQKLIETGKGGVPMRKSTFDLPQLDNSPFYSAMKSNLEVVTAKPKSPRIFQIYDALGPIVQQVGQGKLTPEQGAKLGQEKMLSICSKCLL